MRRLLVLILLFPAAASAAERRYPVPAFDRIRVQGPFEVSVTPGQATEVRIEGEGDLDRARVRVEGGVLTLGGTGGPLRVRIVASGLRAASVSAKGVLTITEIQSDRVELALDGLATLDARGVRADQLTVRAAGAGGLKLAGEAGQMTLRVVGQVDVDAAELTVKDLTLFSENAGEAKLRAADRARITNIGPGPVAVAGSAACEIHGKAPVACASAPR